MQPRKLAITGFPGWLTTAMVDSYLEDQTEAPSEFVFLVHPPKLTAARSLAEARSIPHTIVPFDLEDPQGLPQSSLDGVDAIVHAAGLIHVHRTNEWYRVNTLGSISLGKIAKAAGVRRFVFMSSISAAGRSVAGKPLVENDVPVPEHHYGRSKYLAEKGLLELNDPTFEVVNLRPSMFYGPPVPERHVDIYKRILHGRMPLIGGGRFERSTVYIDNLVQGTKRAITSPNASGQTYFIVDRPIYRTLDVVEAMAAALGVVPRYIRLPAAIGEAAFQVDRLISLTGLYVAPIHLVGESHWHHAASCEKAIQELGYAPRVEMRCGMQAAVDWCRSRGLI